MQKLVCMMMIAAVSTLFVATAQVATDQDGSCAGAASGPGMPYPKLPPPPPPKSSVAALNGPGMPYPKLPPPPPPSLTGTATQSLA